MSESDGQKLHEVLIQLRDGIEGQKTKHESLEASLTLVQSTVNNLEEKLNTTEATVSAANEIRYQQFDLTIQNLEGQIHELRDHVKSQISELTSELRAVFASIRISSPSSSLPPTPPQVNNIMTSCPLFSTSSHESSVHPSVQRTIVVQPPMPPPIFSGKKDDKPRPFLLQLAQYTSSTYGWDKETLFQNIGQFLKETALEWYTQVLTSSSPPSNWDSFHTLFLQQFSSPLRLAQLEQEWKTCVQKPNESINEFLVRLRTLWSEHKPYQKEQDLVRHLFAKARPEIVSLIGVLSDPTLENFLERARIAETIEFSRQKQSSQTKALMSNFSPAPITSTRPRRSSVICYLCQQPGHVAPNCPNTKTSDATKNPEYSKN